jgi:hypothetical protein
MQVLERAWARLWRGGRRTLQLFVALAGLAEYLTILPPSLCNPGEGKGLCWDLQHTLACTGLCQNTVSLP